MVGKQDCWARFCASSPTGALHAGRLPIKDRDVLREAGANLGLICHGGLESDQFRPRSDIWAATLIPVCRHGFGTGAISNPRRMPPLSADASRGALRRPADLNIVPTVSPVL